MENIQKEFLEFLRQVLRRGYEEKWTLFLTHVMINTWLSDNWPEASGSTIIHDITVLTFKAMRVPSGVELNGMLYSDYVNEIDCLVEGMVQK